MTTGHLSDDQLRDEVRARYALAATSVLDTGAGASCGESCCSPTAVEVEDKFGSALYTAGERG